MTPVIVGAVAGLGIALVSLAARAWPTRRKDARP